MKHMKRTNFLAGFLAGFGVLLVGCSKQADVDTANWTKPEAVAQSADSLISSFMLYKWNKNLIALNNDGGPVKIYFLDENERRWGGKDSNNSDFGNKPWGTSLDFDPTANRFVSARGIMMGDTLEVTFLFGSINGDGDFLVKAKPTLRVDKIMLFGSTESNATLFQPRNNRPLTPIYIGGAFSDSTICIPYSIQGETRRNRAAITAEGPFDNGVFCSLDAGKTWQREHISSLDSYAPNLCKSKSYYYYFAHTEGERADLWYSRGQIGKDSWEIPRIIARSCARWDGRYRDVAEGDMVHVCWMDRRHNKWRFNLEGPPIENDDIYYCHRKDSDSDWSKEVLLSKGVLYCYASSMSAEGDKIVVAWAGIQTAGKSHTDYGPNDIYYVTSKDGGNAWTKPLKVTDGAKDGMTAGHPQVMLLNGVIHLFYIQGKMNLQQASGLTKLNQPPWPIYYTQRSFPD